MNTFQPQIISPNINIGLKELMRNQFFQKQSELTFRKEIEFFLKKKGLNVNFIKVNKMEPYIEIVIDLFDTQYTKTCFSEFDPLEVEVDFSTWEEDPKWYNEFRNSEFVQTFLSEVKNN
jgi:hypothetical protein